MDTVKTFAKKYWKHTTIGALAALAATATVVYIRNSDDELDDETTETD